MRRFLWDIDDLDELQERVDLALDGVESYTLEYLQIERGRFSGRFEGVHGTTLDAQPELHVALADRSRATGLQPLIYPSRQRFERKVHLSGTAPLGCTSLVIPLNPEGLTQCGRAVRGGEVLVLAPGEEISFVLPAGCEFFSCDLHPSVVEEMQDALRGSKQPIRGVVRPAEGEHAFLVRTLAEWLKWPDPHNSVESRSRAHASLAVIEAVTNLFLSCAPAVSVDRAASTKRRQIASGAVHFLHSNEGRPVGSAELCRVCDTSRRTLEYAFREHTGLSPIAYHKVRRIRAARAELMRRGPEETSVTEIAGHHGFAHLGRFSVEYKRHWGESPSVTLARTSRVGH